MDAEHNARAGQCTWRGDVKTDPEVPVITTDFVVEKSCCDDCVERWENEGGAA